MITIKIPNGLMVISPDVRTIIVDEEPGKTVKFIDIHRTFMSVADDPDDLWWDFATHLCTPCIFRVLNGWKIQGVPIMESDRWVYPEDDLEAVLADPNNMTSDKCYMFAKENGCYCIAREFQNSRTCSSEE